MDSRDESLPMSPTKRLFTVFGPTSPISQHDIMRPDDFREDGDLCEEEAGEEGDNEEGNASWVNDAVGSRLGHLEAIVEEESGDEKEAKSVDSSLVERLSLGYFDIPPTKKAAPIEKSTPESTNPQIAASLDTDHFGRPRTAERPNTPLPEKREQKKLEPSPFMRSSSPACIDCIASGAHHHHERTPGQLPQSGSANEPLASSLRELVESSSEPSLASQMNPFHLTTPVRENPPKSTMSRSASFSTPPKPARENPPKSAMSRSASFSTPPKPANESPVSTASQIVNISIRENTPPREPAVLQASAPTPPREPMSNPHENPHEQRLHNPATPARQRAPAIPPTPPTTPGRRKSLPADFSGFRKSNPNLPSPVEEERPTTSSGIVAPTQSEHGHGEDKCPYTSRNRNPKEMRHARSSSFQSRPSTPEPGRMLSHSYSAPDIPRLSNRVSSSPESSRLSTYNPYSRPTTPELSRLSQTYTHSRPGSSDGSRLAYSYSRPATPDVGFAGKNTRAPFVDVSEPVSRMPSPPPPTVASSVGTSPASSMHLQPPINFKRDSAARTTPRAVGRSISSEHLFVADRFFKSILEEHNYDEPESPQEEIKPEAKAVEPEGETLGPKTTEPPAPIVYHFIVTFVIPHATKYYLRGPLFWNIFISLCLAFFALGFLVTALAGFVYFFGDSTTSVLRGAPFSEGKLLEELSPLIAILFYLGVFACVTIISRRVINPRGGIKESSPLAEFFGPQRAISIKKLLSPRRLKVLLLLCLITAGTTGLYLGAQTVSALVGPLLTAAVNKGVAASVDFWSSIRASTMEAPVETGAQARVPEAWDEMDFIYFQPDEKVDKSGKLVSSMEGSYGTYYPSSGDKGYHGDEDELSWGAVIRLGLALIVGPAGAMAWRQRRGL